MICPILTAANRIAKSFTILEECKEDECGMWPLCRQHIPGWRDDPPAVSKSSDTDPQETAGGRDLQP